MKIAEAFSLEGRVALVTGAGSGIGEAAALQLAEAGARIAAVGHSEDNVQEAAEKIRRHGGEAIALVADISQPGDMQEAYKKVGEKWGRLDIVFANAGINGVWAPLEELDPAEWDKTLQTNLKGTFLTVKYALPLLKKQGGSIVITSSVNGTRMFSNTGASAYATSKAGQLAFAKMVALELAKDRIRVNVICPGAITTNIGDNTQQRDLEHIRLPVKFPQGQIPLTDGDPGTSEQVARLVHFLASDASDHITGTEMWIDGGQSLFQG
jgi:NAD(P)-dependent dehydrogenase (short-subunit alcohol dehydrogenase family)